MKSGIDSKSQLIPGEDPDEFAAFAAEFTRSCNPADAREQELVDQMIDDAWRLRRLRRAESQVWTRTIENLQSCRTYREPTKVGHAFGCNSESLLRLQRLVSSTRRSYRQAAADLDRLQANRAKSAPSQPEEPLPVQSLPDGPSETADQSQFPEPVVVAHTGPQPQRTPPPTPQTVVERMFTS